jgi:hypothetical protein
MDRSHRGCRGHKGQKVLEETVACRRDIGSQKRPRAIGGQKAVKRTEGRRGYRRPQKGQRAVGEKKAIEGTQGRRGKRCRRGDRGCRGDGWLYRVPRSFE